MRSWGRCRNKRSIEAKQHRGKNLWSFARSQKNLKTSHVNIHYNLAHIKNYTRLAFGESFKKYRDLSVRRALDDKAYVRCGTSEVFSRPLNRPLQVTESHFQLPSSDYPDTVGYVSPGVILLVNDMKEVQHEVRDKFTTTDSTVTVTCKPKHVYPSSATNWHNDMFAVRYFYREEHEVPIQSKETCNLPSRKVNTYLVWLRDSLMQYELMSIEEDYVRVIEGGDHIEREIKRNEVLQKRLSQCLDAFGETDEGCNQTVNEVQQKLSHVQMKVREVRKYLDRLKLFLFYNFLGMEVTAGDR